MLRKKDIFVSGIGIKVLPKGRYFHEFEKKKRLIDLIAIKHGSGISLYILGRFQSYLHNLLTVENKL